MQINPYLPNWRLFLAFLFAFSLNSAHAQLTKLPWDPDPDCNSIVTTGIVAVTCGASIEIDQSERYTFGLIDMNGALPAAGRIDVTLNQDMYHHPSWLVDSIGNVFGITMDNLGNIYLTASSNYSSDFFFVESVIRYGEIGGGAESVEAAGTIYRIDALTAEASVFAVLPQQAYNFTNTTCEGFMTVDRFTGPGLGNIAYHSDADIFYVTNFEDGRIYRVDNTGAILDSYDPLGLDDGGAGVTNINELAYGITVAPDNSELFFGMVEQGNFVPGNPGLYSIPLQADGSFVGTIDNSQNPAGAAWDNFVGTETLHIELSLDGFGDVATISDLEFSPSGNLLVGQRQCCNGTIHTSYNHGGRSQLLAESGGIFNVPLGFIYTSNGVIDDENCYGGVTTFDNPNSGEVEFVISSADMLDESGPHGISTQVEGNFGSPFAPATPAGLIAYSQSLNFPFSDPKGMGGDVYMFKACVLQDCPTAIVGTDLDVCSGELFDLEYTLTGGNPDEVSITWTNSMGMVIDPENAMIMHDACAPAEFEFVVEAICLADSTILTDTALVTAYTTDISPYVTVVEEPCFVDVIIDPDCADFLTIIGDIPVIEPGDVGTAIVQVVQNGPVSCDTLEIELEYNCACSIEGLTATPLDCENGLFMVELDFEHENTTGQFQVFDQNGTPIGPFNYSDLPVVFGPFPGTPGFVYTFEVVDTELPDCTASVDLGPVNCQVNCNAGTEGPICSGDVLGLFENGGDAVGWEWSSDGSAVISDINAQNPTATGVADGETFQVIVTAVTGLIDSCTVIATVFDLPVCEAITDGEICEGDVLQLEEIGGAAVSWSWSSNGSAVISDINAQNPTATGVADGEEFTVEITDANGCVSSCTVFAEVNDLPVCEAVTGGAICEGGELQLEEIGGAAVSWSWSSNGSAVISDINAQNPTATGVADGEEFTVEVTDANGCVSSCTVLAEVNDLPVCEAVTGGAICEGGELQLEEIGGAAVSWSWSSNGSAVISDPATQNPTATGVSDGEEFTVEITDANGCVSSCTVLAEVNDLPVCEASNDGPICAGEPLGLFEDGGDAVGWEWSSDGSAMIDDVNAQNPTATGLSNGETFTVVVTDVNGCQSICMTTAEVFDSPDCTAGNDGPICAGEPLGLFEDGGDAVGWEWSSDGSAVIDDVNGQNPTATGVSDGEVFTVVITDANGCTSSCSTTAAVFAAPEVLALNNGPICEGDILILEAEIMGGTPPFSYAWTHANGFSSSNATVYIQNTTSDDAGVYSLEVTDANGCISGATTEVEINANLTEPGSIAGDEYFCGPGFDPAPIVEVTPPSGANGPIEFFWMMLEEGSQYWEIIPGADGPSYDPGIIYVTTTYSRCVRIDGCIMAIESNMVTKTVGTEAIADPTGMTGICVGDINVYSVTPQVGATYAWDFGNGATPQYASTSTVEVSWDSYGFRRIWVTVTTATCTATNYLDVFVTNNTPYCEAMMNMQPVIPETSVAEGAGILVFPNPFDDRVQIQLESPLLLDGNLRILNVQGALLKSMRMPAGAHQMDVELSDLPAGVYFLQLEAGPDQFYNERIIKQ